MLPVPRTVPDFTPAPPAVIDLGTLDTDAVGFSPTLMGDILIDIAITSASAVAAIGVLAFILVACIALGGL